METTRPIKKLLNQTLYKELICKCWSSSLTKDVQHNLFPSINPDILFLNNTNTATSMSNKNLLLRGKIPIPLHLSTSTKVNSSWNKLLPHDYTTHAVQMKLLTHKTEVENLDIQGIGWAGQPIVKRVHPILPEVYGNISDIGNSMKKVQSSSMDKKSCLLSSGVKTQLHNTNTSKYDGELKEINFNEDRVPDNVQEGKHKSVNHITNNLSTENDVKSHLTEKDANVFLNKKEMIMHESSINKFGKGKTPKLLSNAGLIHKDNKKINNSICKLFKPGMSSKKSKKKSRKKTKVCNSNTIILNSTPPKVAKRKKNTMMAYGKSKNNKIQPQLLFNSLSNKQSLTKNVLMMESRQLKTDSTLYYPKTNDTKVKTIKVELNKKLRSKGSNLPVSSIQKGKSADNCECPENLEIKSARKSINICGEAAEGVASENAKKAKKRKRAMCPRVELKVKHRHRRRTFLCASSTKADKKQHKQRQSCKEFRSVETEQKLVKPKVTICPPISEDINLVQTGAKSCEKKVVEEIINIRKRTKVCKPIIIYGKEETKIKVEKSACTQTHLKVKKSSRHTTICRPTETDTKIKTIAN